VDSTDGNASSSTNSSCEASAEASAVGVVLPTAVEEAAGDALILSLESNEPDSSYRRRSSSARASGFTFGMSSRDNTPRVLLPSSSDLDAPTAGLLDSPNLGPGGSSSRRQGQPEDQEQDILQQQWWQALQHHARGCCGDPHQGDLPQNLRGPRRVKRGDPAPHSQ